MEGEGRAEERIGRERRWEGAEGSGGGREAHAARVPHPAHPAGDVRILIGGVGASEEEHEVEEGEVETTHRGGGGHQHAFLAALRRGSDWMREGMKGGATSRVD